MSSFFFSGFKQEYLLFYLGGSLIALLWFYIYTKRIFMFLKSINSLKGDKRQDINMNELEYLEYKEWAIQNGEEVHFLMAEKQDYVNLKL